MKHPSDQFQLFFETKVNKIDEYITEGNHAQIGPFSFIQGMMRESYLQGYKDSEEDFLDFEDEGYLEDEY